MLLSVLGVARFAAELRESGWLRLALAFFFMYLMFGIVSSTVIGRTRTLAGLYQFISDLKPMLLVMLGYALRWDDRMERWLWIVVRWAWLPMLVCVAFEWVAPGAFFKVLLRWPVGPIASPFGLVPSRALGHLRPSVLPCDHVGSCLSCSSPAAPPPTMPNTRNARSLGRAGRHLWRAAAVLGTAAGDGGLRRGARRGGAAEPPGPHRTPPRCDRACWRCRSRWAWQCCWPSLSREELATWGIGSRLSIESPRAQIFVGAFEVAQRLWPFGSGLGTYGGAGAEKFDHSLYYELGFRYYWWFGKQDFLMDTYWPNPIAEKGIFGAVCLLLCYLALFFFAATRAVSATHLARALLARRGRDDGLHAAAFLHFAGFPGSAALPAAGSDVRHRLAMREAQGTRQKERPRAREVAPMNTIAARRPHEVSRLVALLLLVRRGLRPRAVLRGLRMHAPCASPCATTRSCAPTRRASCSASTCPGATSSSAS